MLRKLRKGLERWLEAGPAEARGANRSREPSILVYYWDGGVPEARKIRDISATGAYIETTETWYPGTIVRLIFRGYTTPSLPDVEVVPSQSVTVSSRVVRQEPGGVAVEFLFNTPKESRLLKSFVAAIPQTACALSIPAISPEPPEAEAGNMSASANTPTPHVPLNVHPPVENPR